MIVCDDETTHLKKGKTVMNGKERAGSLMHCRWVDEVIEHAPWVITQEFIDKHDVSIYNSTHSFLSFYQKHC